MPKEILVIAGDGGKARIWRYNMLEKNLTLDKFMKCENHAEQELHRDRQGSSFDRVGTGRHKMEFAANKHELEKREFAEELAMEIDNIANQKKYYKIICAAPSKFMHHLKEKIADFKNINWLQKDIANIQNSVEMKSYLGAILP